MLPIFQPTAFTIDGVWLVVGIGRISNKKIEFQPAKKK
jgi:hypothetical protein